MLLGMHARATHIILTEVPEFAKLNKQYLNNKP